MSNILISGCSFTASNNNHDWPANLIGHTVTNLAYPGAGNKYIADSIINKVSQTSYDLVLVMWSGITRLEFPVADAILFSDYVCKQNINHNWYIMSGGIAGSWQDHQMTTTLFKNIYKFLSDEQLAIMSLGEIIKLQGFLKNKNIKYYFMSYLNYWNQDKRWMSPNCDKSLSNFENLQPLISQIDFSQWIFLNDNKDSIFDLATELNSFIPESKFHPGETANAEWAKIVLNKINEAVLDDKTASGGSD